MAPFARSYSTSNFSRKFWPSTPLPPPTSLPPTRNSIFLRVTPASVNSFTVVALGEVEPPMPLTLYPKGNGLSLKPYSDAVAELNML